MVVADYEKIFILKPDISDEDVEKEISSVTSFITENKGTVTNEDRWGKRRLAYAIKKQRYGNYTVLRFTAPPSLIPEMEKQFRFNENFLKSLVMLHDSSTGKKSEREIAAAKRAEERRADEAAGRDAPPPRVEEN